MVTATTASAAFIRHTNTWGARIPQDSGVMTGMPIRIVRRNGWTTDAFVGEITWQGRGATLCTTTDTAPVAVQTASVGFTLEDITANIVLLRNGEGPYADDADHFTTDLTEVLARLAPSCDAARAIHNARLEARESHDEDMQDEADYWPFAADYLYSILRSLQADLNIDLRG